MTENSEEMLTKDPSLKRYFKYMLVNRKMSVQFTSKKIREIVENDLDIKLESKSVYSKMCIDAFAYYMQSWPEWQLAVKSTDHDKWYNSLRNFLKTKLLNLKQHEKDSQDKNKTEHELALPDDVIENINNQTFDNIDSITLNINVPDKVWNRTQINFKDNGLDDLLLDFQRIQKTNVLITDSDIINHPYISIEFNVPGLISIQRSSPFKTERYLHSSKVSPYIDSELIHSIEQTQFMSSPKVYTHRLLNSFFNKLKNLLETSYSTAVDISKRTEILKLCDEFLSDIFEANVSNATVCEGYHVNFNMSRRSYFINNVIESPENTSENVLIYKKVLIPVISYSLKNCSLQQEDITKDGYTLFKFLNHIDKTFETAFLHYISNSISYKCILCDTYYILYELKQHLMTNHPLESNYQCSKCYKNLSVKQLLQQRWNHECSVILSSASN